VTVVPDFANEGELVVDPAEGLKVRGEGECSSAVGSHQLPDLDHRDPVDRLLLATARQRQASFLTCDRGLLVYGGVETVDARK
jgi:predicted nucleic acid-binding protein